MRAKLPQHRNFGAETTVSGLARQLEEYQAAVTEFLRAQPEFEEREYQMEAPGDDDIVLTDLPTVTHVIATQVLDATNNPVAPGSIAWTPSSDLRRPGIVVAFPDLTPGDTYAVKLLLLGRRQ